MYVWCLELNGRHFGLWRSIRVYVWCMEIDGRQLRSMEVNTGVCLVHLIIWSAVLVCGGQSGRMYGAWNYMVGSFGLWRSIRVYVWCMELYGSQFCL